MTVFKRVEQVCRCDSCGSEAPLVNRLQSLYDLEPFQDLPLGYYLVHVLQNGAQPSLGSDHFDFGNLQRFVFCESCMPKPTAGEELFQNETTQ